MSAIAGIYCLNGNAVDCQQLQEMTDKLSHRGSDDSNIWSQSAIGFGHRMLWTTPESVNEKLPLVNDNGLAITADARIDNRDELIGLLNLDNVPSEKIADSQLILSAYEKWQDSCVDKLIGDFAFAIWDGQRKSLFCARDHFGVKPFYYYYGDSAFVFASEIKGLLCVPQVPCQLNQKRIGDYLALLLHDKENTFYQNIFRLPPAQTIKIDREGIKKVSYWSVDSEYELKLDSDEEYAHKFKELFTEAVRCRLRSAYPVGSMLSGGLDSSSITCTARNIFQETNQETNQENFRTYSFIFDEVSQSDERFFIDKVVEEGKISPSYVCGDRISPLVDIEKIFWHHDEPLYLPDLYLNWRTYELANQLGDRVLLDGFDGDHVISYGLGYLKELKQKSQLQKLVQEARLYSKNILGKDFDTLRAKKKDNTPTYSWKSSLNEEFVERLKLIDRREVLKKARYGVPTTQRQQHCYDLDRGALVAKLEGLDKTAAAFGVELRYPFLDKRLVEFCVSLPAEQKMQLGWTRMILRRGMEGILPKEIQWRGDKGDLGHAFRHGLKTFERENFKEAIENPELIEHYINMPYLEQTYKNFIAESYKIKDILSLWKSLNLFQWLKWFQKRASE